MGDEARWQAVTAALAGQPGVALPSPAGRRRFGHECLQVDGAIFAMTRGDALVVKLPRERVAALIDTGDGAAFGAGRGAPMREWVSVAGGDERAWLALAHEALAFVGRRSGASGTGSRPGGARAGVAQSPSAG